MIVKVFQKNNNGKIEFTKKELETLLNEVYWQGRNDAYHNWTYTTTPAWTCKIPNQRTPNYTVNTLENITTPISDNIRVIKDEI